MHRLVGVLVVVCGAATLAPSLRELLSEARLRECTSLNGTHPRFSPYSVGVANLATRWHEVPLPPLEGEAVER